jgi:hypothetical protein
MKAGKEMFSAVLFVLAVATFALGLSLATYRWIALQNAWPMGAWQAEKPFLPRLIGLGAVAIALFSTPTLGGAAVALVILFGLIGAVVWIGLLKVGAQSALLLAPAAALLTVIVGLY